MADGKRLSDLRAALGSLKPKDKQPNSSRVLDNWIAQAETTLSVERGGRLGWIIASTVVTAALQRATDIDGNARFLLKGGTLLQHHLGTLARATRDLDGLVRGDIDDYLAALEETVAEPWGPLTLERGQVEVIEAPTRIIKPRRFDMLVLLRGARWRKIQVEIAPDEGNAGSVPDLLAAPPLTGFGLPTPDHLAALAMRYQIAQKIHAASDPHDPPAFVNDRPRDVIDLILLRDLVNAAGSPTLAKIREAVEDIFTARAHDADTLGRPARRWPATVTTHPHWQTAYTSAAESAGITLTLEEAVAEVNDWLRQIAIG
jgi:hypothetical protein